MSNDIAVEEQQHRPLDGRKPRGIGSRILRIIWDNDDKSVEERKFVSKLDSMLLTIVRPLQAG